MKLSIITACSRPNNLDTIYKSINFDKIHKWYIIYDTSKCRTYDLRYSIHPKILELDCDTNGFAGHPQINYALSLIEDGFVYIIDDDNIVHEEFWKILPTLDSDYIYTWDQNRIRENRIMLGGIIKLGNIDTSQFIVPRKYIGSIRWSVHRSGGDFLFINQIHKKHADKFKYINKVACYHNFIQRHKIAVCFFGLTRSLKYTIASIKKYIFTPLKNAGIKYDVLLHTYKVDSLYSNPRAGEKNIRLNNNDYKLLNPVESIIDNKSEICKKIQIEKFRTMGNPWGPEDEKHTGDFTTLDNHVLFLWSQKRLTDLWSKGDYTHIMMLRPDVLYCTPLKLEWFDFNSNAICIPNFQLYHTVNDRFAIGRPEQMLLYGNRFNDALEYSKTKPLASEEFLKATIKKSKIKCKYIDFYFIRLRANKEKNILDVNEIKSITRRNRIHRSKGTRKNKK